VDKLRDFEK
jgi:hypothetical protein